jgi:hypothetical protein
MPVCLQATHQLNQMRNLIQSLSQQEYADNLPLLAQNSIGKHCRHVIEFYICLLEGQANDTVDYDKRNRDLQLEIDKHAALAAIDHIATQLPLSTEKPMLLLATYPEGSTQLNTTFFREIVYNIEHTIHHLAIIKMAISTHFPHLTLPDEVGFAYSTMQHAKQHTNR